jgi:hypothetical protein
LEYNIGIYINFNGGYIMCESFKEVYETPEIEVIEFELVDSIATSVGPDGAFGGDEIAGGMW